MGAIVYGGKPSEIVDYNLRHTETGVVYDPDTYVEMVFKPHGASVWMAKWNIPDIGIIIIPAKLTYIKASAKKRLRELKLEPVSRKVTAPARRKR